VGFTNAPFVPPIVPGVAVVVVAAIVDGSVDDATSVTGDAETPGAVAVGGAACVVPGSGSDPSADVAGAPDTTTTFSRTMFSLDAEASAESGGPADTHASAVQIRAGRAATPIAIAGRSWRLRAEPGSSNMRASYPPR
jgi:hypothetical protein